MADTTEASYLATTTPSPSNGTLLAGFTKPLFHWADYLVFGISLGIPLVIGVFFMFYKRKESTTQDFLTGERSMNFIVVSLSLLASLLNGAFVIGVPAEIHYYGTAYSYMTFGLLFAALFASHIFIPKYHAMTMTSAYQYIERRYNKPTRIVASLVFIVSVVVFLAIVLYVPALSFSQVTNLTLYTTIIITGVICTVYTAIGGIKAVVWTDAIQMVILLVGLIIIAVLGAKEAGGAQRVWELAVSGHRITYDEFSFDPRSRVTFWSQSIGQGVVFLCLFISNQMMIQRYLGITTSAKAQLSLYFLFLFFLPLVVLIVFIGLVLHASYAHCDPLFTGQLKSPDQIFSLYVMDLLGEYHGVPGLITASIFAAALSSVSAVINSLSAVCLEDFIDPIALKIRKKPFSDRQRRAIAVGIVVFFGALTVGLSFAADKFSDKLVQATGTIWGVLGGPLGGMFLLGFLVPCSNSAGAIVGVLCGLVISLWVCIGNIMYGTKADTLPLFDCVHNRTLTLPVRTPNTTVDRVPLQDLYDVSFAWYGVIGTGSCVIVGFIVSVLTGGCSKKYRASIDPSLMFSFADQCCCCCPAPCVECYRCGVDYDAEKRPPSSKDPDADDGGGGGDDGGYVDVEAIKSGGNAKNSNGKSKLYNGKDSYDHIYTTGQDGIFRRHTSDDVMTTPAPPYDDDVTGHVNNGYVADRTTPL